MQYEYKIYFAFAFNIAIKHLFIQLTIYDIFQLILTKLNREEGKSQWQIP